MQRPSIRGRVSTDSRPGANGGMRSRRAAAEWPPARLSARARARARFGRRLVFRRRRVRLRHSFRGTCRSFASRIFSRRCKALLGGEDREGGEDSAARRRRAPSAVWPLRPRRSLRSWVSAVVMISVGEALVLFAAGAWALGPRELPRYARALGRLAGRASAQIAAARSQFQTFAERNDVATLHDEVNQTMSELRAIQAELRGGLNLSQPGPMTRRLLGISGGEGVAGAEAVGDAAGASAGARPVFGLGVEAAGTSSGSGAGSATLSAAPGAGGASLSGAAPLPPPAGSAAAVTSSPSFAVGMASAALMSADVSPVDGVASTPRGVDDGLPALEALPISAAAAGRVPDRSGTTPTGSEVVLDALMEEKIASHAVSFLRGAGKQA